MCGKVTTRTEPADMVGYLCPTPASVKSARLRLLLFLEDLAPVPGIAVTGREHIEIHGGLGRAELKCSKQIDMLPRDGRNPANECHRLLIIHGRLVFVHLRQQR